jgi:4-amino-4-deoxy-L-arabinose transferase-like glycosyltransferase
VRFSLFFFGLHWKRKDCFFLALVFELLESYDFRTKWYLGFDFYEQPYLGFWFY